MEKLSKLLRDLLSSHPIKCSYILYFYLGESLSLKKLHCTHKLMINYCTKFWQSKKVMCNFPMNSGGTGLDTSGAITQFGTTFESSSGLEVREIWSIYTICTFAQCSKIRKKVQTKTREKSLFCLKG